MSVVRDSIEFGSPEMTCGCFVLVNVYNGNRTSIYGNAASLAPSSLF